MQEKLSKEDFLRQLFVCGFNPFDIINKRDNELHVMLQGDKPSHNLCPCCFFWPSTTMANFKKTIDGLRTRYGVEKVIIHSKKQRILELSDDELNNPDQTWQLLYKLDKILPNADGSHGDGCSYVPKFAGLDWVFES